jgi:macrolide transport system ATP-binding/permease protein
MNNQQTPLIELRDIYKTYQSGELSVEVLHGINLTVHQGEFVAIMGSSGSGKSTLMNILGCLDKPTKGSYLFNGQDVSDFERDDLARLRREEFGFIFQSYNLIGNATAAENVEVPAVYAGVTPASRRQKALKLLSELGLDERTDHKPSQLSGGQQQRVSIARALMNGGRIILADEPTGALDSKSGTEVMRLLGELSAKGHTIILITHERRIAEYADRIIEIRDGDIVDDTVRKQRTAKALEEDTEYRSTSRLTEVTEATKTALRALRSNIFRTILTLLGIVIGVASVISMLAIGDGAKQAVVERISSMGSNLLNVRPGAPNMRGRVNIVTLVPADVEAIKDIPNILAAVPEQESSVTARRGSSDHRTQINATSSDYTTAQQWFPAKGTFFSKEDEESYSTIAVLGGTVAKALFGNEDPIGEFMLINNIPFQVIGVMKERGAGMGGRDQDDVIFLPYTTGSLRLTGQNYLRNITVAVKDVSQINKTQEEVHAAILAMHGGVEDFQIRNMAALIESVSETQNTLTILLGSIAAISLLVGGIGVMNIMLVSVTERTREIGIRMATGARMRNILQQFLIEAVTVSALGGLIGVALGLGAAAIIEALGTPVYYSTTPVIAAFGCAFATGLVFGYLPARKAARLDPVTALASE